MARTPRKILLMKLRSLGDTLLLTAPIASIKEQWPDVSIHLAVNSKWSELFLRDSRIARVWTYDKHKETPARAKAVAHLALKLYREKFDVVVNFHASPSSATVALATRAPIRAVHFHGHKAKNKYSTVEIPGKGILKPIIERDMDSLRAIGLKIPEGLLPEVSLSYQEVIQGRERIRFSKGVPLLAIGLGSARPAKAWPINRFAEIAVRWCERGFDGTPGAVVGFTGPDENSVAHDFLKAIDDLLAHRSATHRQEVRDRIQVEMSPNIRTMAAMMKNCQAFIGNDSGPRHLAVAVGTPSLTLFGPEDPFEWHPYPVAQHPFLFIENLGCRNDHDQGFRPWCGVHECVNHGHQCMEKIGIEETYAKLVEMGPAIKDVIERRVGNLLS